MIDFISFCDYTGTFAFAISGIRLASAKQFDWFGAYVIGVVTAVGGGTIRDILLNATPFWMEQASYLIISALALLFVIIFRKYVISLNNTFFIFDAIGLGLFGVVGIEKALAFGFPMWVDLPERYLCVGVRPGRSYLLCLLTDGNQPVIDTVYCCNRHIRYPYSSSKISYKRPRIKRGRIKLLTLRSMTANMNTQSEKASILLIYTGGTIGMIENPETGVLESFNFQHLKDNMPELKKLGYAVSTIQFDPVMDSSEMGPESWMKIVKIIADNYQLYDGFVVLHGTDTMSFTASALSFMLENLSKPVIFTGSQLPIGMLRTDGKENLITAIEIAAAKENGVPVVPEVCIFFENDLLRGNRTSKINADNFNAFRSYNYPPLAHAGIYIKYDTGQVYHPVSRRPLKPHYLLDRNIAVLKLFPGISPQVVESILNIPGLKGVVMETFGSGNAPCYDWFLTMLKEAVSRGIVIVNVTQCSAGSVEMHRYETGHKLLEAGVISGFDSTTESAVTKLMFLFGHGLTPEEVKDHMNCSLIGEVTIPDTFRP